MKVKLEKNDIIDMIKIYYKKEEDLDVSVNITATKELLGYGLATYEDVVVKFIVSGSILLAGQMRNFEYNLTLQEVKKIINAMLYLEGFKVVNITIDKKLEANTFGYGMYEGSYKTAIFKGMDLEIEKCINDMSRSRNL